MPETTNDTWEDKPAQKHEPTKEELMEKRLAKLEKIVKEIAKKVNVPYR
jgi:hypothetical protein